MYINQNTKQVDMTAEASKYPQGYFKSKACKECKTIFTPNAPSHMYCSQVCQDRAYTRAYLRRKYKISVEQWEALFEKQQHLCAICKTEGFKLDPRSSHLLVVDHCHKTGAVRGLLCHNCNRGLGLFQDKINNLKTAIKYLEAKQSVLEYT